MTIVDQITPLDLFNILQDTATSQLVIDARSQDKYKHGRVRASVNIDLETGDRLEQVHSGGVELNSLSKDINFRLRGRLCYRAVIYDDERRVSPDETLTVSDGNSSDDSILRSVSQERLSEGMSRFDFDFQKPADVLAAKLQAEGKLDRVDVLSVPFNKFAEKYPFLVSSDDNKARPFRYASQIIEDFLFLGNRGNAHSEDELSDLGITHIVNTAQEIPNRFEEPGKVEYLTIGVGDTVKDNIDEHFDTAFDFIERARASGGKVLVHCAMGISRSSTVTISYLMRRYALPFDTCKQIVKERRSCILPNPGFATQLKAIERQLIEQNEKEQNKGQKN